MVDSKLADKQEKQLNLFYAAYRSKGGHDPNEQ